MSAPSAAMTASPSSIGRWPRVIARQSRKTPQTLATSPRKRWQDGRPVGRTKLCILDQQVKAIGGFVDLGAIVQVPDWVGAYRLVLFQGHQPTQGLPARVGQCSYAEISSISDRFGEALKPPANDVDSGTAISFTNGGGQVSYDYVPAIARSKVGDQLLLCLVSIPQNCPPGDNRGKFYSGTNLRTKDSWILPDSQHMCGGA